LKNSKQRDWEPTSEALTKRFLKQKLCSIGIDVEEFETERLGADKRSAHQKIPETKALFDFTHQTSLPKLAAAELIPPLDDFISNEQ